MPVRTCHQAGCGGIQAAAYELAAVAPCLAIGDEFDTRRSRSSACCRSAGGSNSADRVFQPDNGDAHRNPSPVNSARFTPRPLYLPNRRLAEIATIVDEDIDTTDIAEVAKASISPGRLVVSPGSTAPPDTTDRRTTTTLSAKRRKR